MSTSIYISDADSIDMSKVSPQNVQMNLKSGGHEHKSLKNIYIHISFSRSNRINNLYKNHDRK